MKYCFLVLLFILTQRSFAQMNPELMRANWNPGAAKVIFGNTVMRVSGTNNGGGMTNVALKTKAQLLKETNETAAKEKWTAEKKAKTLASYENGSGALYLYITRTTKETAAGEAFTLVIKDAGGKQEVFREQLKSGANPPIAGSKFWWNYQVKFLPAGLKGKYNIYILDAQGKENKAFQFEIDVL